MNKTLLTELFEKPNAEFSKHISDPQNVRILFSGKFGIGKTTFINQYFAGKEDGYVKIHLYPVNYSIASNEDIIDLIKYDILMELIREGAEFTCEDISKVDAIVGFTKENSIEVVKALIGCIPKIGKEVNAAYNGLENIGKSFDEYYKGKKNDEGDTTNDFANLIKNGKGLIYENSAITSIICNKIDQLAKEKKKVVLVIDDLDRIDPDHIFRLFNVFAAHFDSTAGDSSSNKFGFDKVMFVCDVENIRSIFKHKYGAETDFGGYIDKFYSKEVYEFDNILDVDKLSSLLVDKYIITGHNNSTPNILHIVNIFIAKLLSLRVVNLRSLVRYLDKNRSQSIDTDVHSKLRSSDFLIACQIIRKIFGNDIELITTLVSNNKTNNWEIQNTHSISHLLFESINVIHYIENNNKDHTSSEISNLVDGFTFYKNESNGMYTYSKKEGSNNSLIISILIKGIRMLKATEMEEVPF